jgi:hypothetical protein
MSKAGGRTALITSAMLVAGIRLWLQIRGKTTTPFSQWAIGWGATFFILSLLSEAAPSAAGSLSLVIATSDFLKNGVGLTTDISSLIGNTEAVGSPATSPLVANPFGTGAGSNVASGFSVSNTQKSNSPRESTKVGG